MLHIVKTAIRLSALLGVLLVLAGCAANGAGFDGVSATQPVSAPLPRAFLVQDELSEPLVCIRQSRALVGKKFLINPTRNNTGKQSVTEGGDGSFLQARGVSSWITEAVLAAGGKPVDFYRENTAQPSWAHYRLYPEITALAFVTSATVDFQGGSPHVGQNAGPSYRNAQANAAFDVGISRFGKSLTDQADKETFKISSVHRNFQFREFGFSTNGRFVSGGLSIGTQDKLQHGLKGMMFLAIADVLSGIPELSVPQKCRDMVEAVLYAKPTKTSGKVARNNGA